MRFPHTRLTTAFRSILFLILAWGAQQAGAQSIKVLYALGASGTDAASPLGALIADKTSLYGTANIGGEFGLGAVFQLTKPASPGLPWTETILYSFVGGSDGSRPTDALAMDSTGTLYGTTSSGGTNGDGVVFKLAPPAVPGDPWSYSLIHSFAGADGATPYSGIGLDRNGVLYGTTIAGGKFGVGTVYKVTPPAAGGTWTESVLWSFSNAAGAPADRGCEPYAAVTLSPGGALYGTTQACGANNGGVVYRLAPPAPGQSNWSQSVLHSFVASGAEGYAPMAGLVFGQNRKLFGCTQAGNGSAFELSPPAIQGGPWTEQVIASLPSNSYCQGNLTIDPASGTIYGTALLGGVNNAGNIFSLTPPNSGGAWSFTDLYDFTGNADGAFPYAGLLLRGGVLYGTTSAGGNSNFVAGGGGTIFGLVP
jgi:uncharacterized repeat protein (TIGR03803 family)